MVEKKNSFNGLDDDNGLDLMSFDSKSSDESAALIPTTTSAPDASSSSTTATTTSIPQPPPPADSTDEDNLPPPYAQVVSTAGQGFEGQDNNDNDEETRRQKHERVKCGAGVASGVFGMLMGGPVLAILLGFGTAYAADQTGPAGDVARSIGEIALVAQRKFQKLDDQHKFVENGKVMAAKAVHKLQEADREHRFVDRVKDFAITSFRSIALFVKEHRIIERGTQAVGKAAYWVANKIADKIQAHQQQQQQQASSGGGSASSPPQYRAVSTSDKLDDNRKSLGK